MSAIRALRNRFSNNNRRNSSSEPRIIELGAARSMFRNPPTASETSAAAATKLSAFSNGSDWKKNVGGSNGTLSIPDGMSVDHLEPTVLVNFAGLTTYSFKKVEISDATEKEMEHVVVKDEMDGDTKPADVTLTIEITTQDLLSKDTSEALNHSCPICMCDFENGDMVRRLKCGHEYHMSCVDPWVLSRPPIAPSFPISSSSSPPPPPPPPSPQVPSSTPSPQTPPHMGFDGARCADGIPLLRSHP
ncbi:hypothetical protein BC829DRAFT_48546 [Chytridium lagenaria]|nr:hypothetical protein BC829DRAFT_48546 [Chytridium lagenaria]